MLLILVLIVSFIQTSVEGQEVSKLWGGNVRTLVITWIKTSICLVTLSGIYL